MSKVLKSSICLLILALWATSVPAQETKSVAGIKFTELEKEFGSIQQGDKAHLEFKFTSTGLEALVISQAKGSCGCTVPEYPTQPLKKGEKGVIKVTFDSAGKMGKQEKTVTLITNTADSPIVLKIKGNIEPATPKNVPEARPLDTPKN